MVREIIGDIGKKINENERRKRESFGFHGFFFRPLLGHVIFL